MQHTVRTSIFHLHDPHRLLRFASSVRASSMRLRRSTTPSMQLEIFHQTRYIYDREVQFQPHLLYLRPRENPLLHVERYDFASRPPARLDWMRDDFDNLPASASFSGPSSTLEITSRCLVTTADTHPFDFLLRDYAVAFPFTYEPLHRFNLSIYLQPPRDDVQHALRLWLDQRFTLRPTDTISWLAALNQVVQRSLGYQRRDEIGIQTSTTTMRIGTGSCRDFAALFVDCARTLGLAARFVSGYMYDTSSQGYAAGSMHAWVEVFLPGAGWRALDPTHGIFCDNTYVPVAHAVVAESVNPIQGAFYSLTPACAQLTADVRVQRTP
jgi:transglutaminase-like putative cysteine protease